MDFMLMGWVKQFVATAIAGAGGGVTPVVVTALPAVGDPTKLYLVSKTTSGTYNYYDEYLWVVDKYEQIGSTAAPSGNYVTEDELNAAIAAAISDTGVDSKMDKTNPVGTGSFSMNRHTAGGYAIGEESFAAGHSNVAEGYASFAEGSGNVATGEAAHAEGYNTVASGAYSHAEGDSTEAKSDNAHAEGHGSIASGDDSHAEGTITQAAAKSAHAEGYYSEATGYYSHAEGKKTKATNDSAHSEGDSTQAAGRNSHAEGEGTVAAGRDSHAQGRYNIKDEGDTYAHIVGNGNDAENLSNAHTLDWSGNAWFAGKVRVGGTSWEDGIELGAGGSEATGPYAFYKASNETALEGITYGLLTLADLGITVDDGKFASFPLGISISSTFASGRKSSLFLSSIGESGELIYEDLHEPQKLTVAVDGTMAKDIPSVEIWNFTLEDGTTITKIIKVIE